MIVCRGRLSVRNEAAIISLAIVRTDRSSWSPPFARRCHLLSLSLSLFLSSLFLFLHGVSWADDATKQRICSQSLPRRQSSWLIKRIVEQKSWRGKGPPIGLPGYRVIEREQTVRARSYVLSRVLGSSTISRAPGSRDVSTVKGTHGSLLPRSSLDFLRILHRHAPFLTWPLGVFNWLKMR